MVGTLINIDNGGSPTDIGEVREGIEATITDAAVLSRAPATNKRSRT